MDSFDLFRTRRHTTLLALVAIGVSAGILTWSVMTIRDLSSSGGPANYAAAGLASALASPAQQSNAPAKADRGLDTKSLMADAFAKRMTTAVLPERADPKLAGWENDLDWLHQQSVAAVGQAIDNVPTWQTAGLSVSPALADRAAPTPVAGEPTAVVAPVGSAPTAAPFPADADPPAVRAGTTRTMTHAAREPAGREGRAESARGAKPRRVASRGSYVEKTVEQGDSGDVSFRYRRRACTPGNMLDVCYMPAADRQRIVIERY
jgi:hypothetical protein